MGLRSSSKALVLLLLSCSCAAASAPVHAHPAPHTAPPGLLFHASFGTGIRADFAVGSDLPYLGNRQDPARRLRNAMLVQGVFDQAATRVAGSFDALANVLAERGTLCFFIRKRGHVYGFDPLVFETIDWYNWHTYLRLSYAGNHLTAWFPNQVYRVHQVRAPSKIKLEDGTWHHLALAWDQAYGAVLYVDGTTVASDWGTRSWFSRGVDPSELRLAWQDGTVAYDELYVFDRPLAGKQIRRLAEHNQPPGEGDLPTVQFDERRRRNRLEELSWSHADPAMFHLDLGAETPGRAGVQQILPSEAKALLGDAGAVFDGKLGEGWPSPQNRYTFNEGNGLSIRVAEGYDLVTLEGEFHGKIYSGRHLLEPEGLDPLRRIDSTAFLTRWRPAREQKGWLTFFWNPPSERKRVRIAELGFFKSGAHLRRKDRPDLYFLQVANRNSEHNALCFELAARYGTGDRTVLGLAAHPSSAPGKRQIPGLRFHHLAIPARSTPWVLRALRLRWRLRASPPGNAFRIEVHDPSLAGRRLFASDFTLDSSTHEEKGWLDVTLDLADRVIPAGRPLWLTFVFREDLQLVAGGREDGSQVEVYTGSGTLPPPEFLRDELSFVKSRFRTISEARPWSTFRDPEVELTAFNRRAEELFAPLTRLWRWNPGDSRIRALWYWTHKKLPLTDSIQPKPVTGHPRAPRWALWQRELLHRIREALYWWIENRQAPDGEFGDDWNDDTDLIQNFPALTLLADPNRILARSAAGVAEGVHGSGRMKDGINARPKGPLHAYEDGINAQAAMALIEYGNPVYLERLMEASRTIEERLTRLDARGHRRFRSSYFGAGEVREKGSWGYDTPNNAILLHPALVLGYYNHNPRAIRFVQSWIDGWLEAYRVAEESGNHPRGRPYPARTLSDGSVLRWEARPRGFGYVSAFNAAYALTGAKRYRAAVRYWTGEYAPQRFLPDPERDQPALELMDRGRYRDQLIHWAEQADLSHPARDDLGSLARQRYMKWELTGNDRPAYEALEAAVRKMRLMFDAFTWAEPIADRIWMPSDPLLMMAQGEISYRRNQTWPRHYVSYEGFSDLAAWVREKSETHLTVWIYSFADHEERGAIRFWRTPLGLYSVAFGEDGDRDGHPDHPGNVNPTLHRSAALPLRLAPGKLFALEIRLQERSPEDYWKRPDLAVAPRVRVPASDRLTVRVHNLGGSRARDVVVRLMDDRRRRIAERRISVIEAPLDLVARSRIVEFESVGGYHALTVEVDPENLIPELNEENNVQRIRINAPEKREQRHR